MELRYLQAFTLLAEELHFGRAAKRLGVVQPAFSRTIKALEDEVGFPLVRRSSKVVALTPAGEAFLVPAQAALKRTDDAVRAARLRSANVTGELRLGMMIGAAQPAVGRLIATFTRRYPEVRVSLKMVEERRLGTTLATDQFDAVIAWDASVPAGCYRRTIAAVRLAVLVPQGDPLSRRRFLSLEHLAGRGIILPAREAQPFIYERYRAMCREAGFELKIALDVDTVSDVFAMVAGGAGIGNAPIAPGERYPGVVVVPMKPAVDLAYDLVWTQPSREVERLVACIA